MAGDEGVLGQRAQAFEGAQPLGGVGLLDPRVDLAEDVVAGEGDALLDDADGGWNLVWPGMWVMRKVWLPTCSVMPLSKVMMGVLGA